MASLRQKQIASVRQMVNLNTGCTIPSLGSETVFSVLIYDRHGQDIISPLLSVKELREMGVTLHLLLHSERGEIPDVPAIYFCQPTEENLVRIGQDFTDGLYSSYYLNFTSPISRQKMEDLAQTALQANCQASIKKVYDQYVNFICLEENMFCLKHQGSDSISYHGQVPVIRCQSGNASQMVAERLDKKLRENLRDTRNSFFTGLSSDAFATGQLSFHRPLLVLLDRNIDLSSPLHHTWTYQALTHDLLNLSLNRVYLPQTENVPVGKKPKNKEYELSNADSFWVNHKSSPFPMVAAAVETELEDYKSSEEKIKGLKSDFPASQPEDFFNDNTAILTSAITSLPELLKRKANIDKHMSIAMGLLNCIKNRKLDVYFELEEKLMARTALEKPLLEVIRDPEMGSANDKLRLFLIFYLCATEVNATELKDYTDALKEAGVNLEAFTYIKRWKSLLKMTAAPSEYTGGVAKTVSMFSKLMNQGSSIVVEGVKNFVLKENKLPITRIVDNLMELKNCEEERRFFDAVVFVVGGGNYMEFTNLSLYAKNKATSSPKRLVYGCTDVVNAEQFLAQLCKLGAAIA
ncbi:Sec1 family domain-containing protein 1 [Armadillidium nasatum]|uniref:Sec1 family domain-containing protein 1 n=1 Tax=Armadillidium nasatum TaxID=96803 RepID=A0A5N5T083_9CRUS|nr:Sec1 family domain-containing protein 1 [Armadillidium nasatum]